MQDEGARKVIQTVAEQLTLGKLNIEQALSVLDSLLPRSQVVPQLLQLLQGAGLQVDAQLLGPGLVAPSTLPGSTAQSAVGRQPGAWGHLNVPGWAGQLQSAAWEEAAAGGNVQRFQ